MSNTTPLKTCPNYAPEVRQRAVRMGLDHEGDYPSRWAAIKSVAKKIGCAPQSLHEWVRKTEVDSGKRAGVPTDVAEKMKVVECATLAWVEWSNRRRLLEPIGNIPPAEAEKDYYAAVHSIPVAA